MRKDENIISYSAKELANMRKKGKSKSNWEAVKNIKDQDLEKIIKSDVDSNTTIPEEWEGLTVGFPEPKEQISLRVDKDVLRWFRGKGKGYQTYMNNILRSYVSMQEKHSD